MTCAIVTKYLGPTNIKGSRIKATGNGLSVTIPYDNNLSTEEAHRKAASALASKFGWTTRPWHGGALPKGGFVFVEEERRA